jgi:hypothetical protein
MPITIFVTKGIPATRREGIETAVVAGGRNVTAPHEAWIAADPLRGGFKVLVTGPHGLERAIYFAGDEDPGVVTAHVRAALNE